MAAGRALCSGHSGRPARSRSDPIRRPEQLRPGAPRPSALCSQLSLRPPQVTAKSGAAPTPPRRPQGRCLHPSPRRSPQGPAPARCIPARCTQTGPRQPHAQGHPRRQAQAQAPGAVRQGREPPRMEASRTSSRTTVATAVKWVRWAGRSPNRRLCPGPTPSALGSAEPPFPHSRQAGLGWRAGSLLAGAASSTGPSPAAALPSTSSSHPSLSMVITFLPPSPPQSCTLQGVATHKATQAGATTTQEGPWATEKLGEQVTVSQRQLDHGPSQALLATRPAGQPGAFQRQAASFSPALSPLAQGCLSCRAHPIPLLPAGHPGTCLSLKPPG